MVVALTDAPLQPHSGKSLYVSRGMIETKRMTRYWKDQYVNHHIKLPFSYVHYMARVHPDCPRSTRRDTLVAHFPVISPFFGPISALLSEKSLPPLFSPPAKLSVMPYVSLKVVMKGQQR